MILWTLHTAPCLDILVEIIFLCIYMTLEFLVWEFKSISKSISRIDLSLQNMSIARNKDNWFSEKLMRANNLPTCLTIYNAHIYADSRLSFVDWRCLQRFNYMLDGFSKNFIIWILFSAFVSQPGDLGYKGLIERYQTRLSMSGVSPLWKPRQCQWGLNRTEALEAERTERLEGGRWVALGPGRDAFCEGGRTDRLDGGRLVQLLDGNIEKREHVTRDNNISY
jgi:hypothetical protein